MKVLHVLGARPNFMKIAPLMRALDAEGGVDQVLVHTGQHYDEAMSERFFAELSIPRPDLDLGVGSGSHAVQTAEVMKAFEPVLLEHDPDVVVVVGDVNSTVACTLVAAKLHVPVAHVEAGLRSGDRCMPEELNRLVTDQLAELLLTPSRDADRNLLAEGIPREKIHFVGNIMIDTLRAHLDDARETNALERHGLEPGGYHLVTMHRPSNVDHPEQLREIFSALATLAAERPVVFPMHPRTLRNAKEFDALEILEDVRVIEPVGYLEMLALMESAGLVLTDSGGMQEETTALGVPCLTLRDSTERPVTVEEGTNTMVPVRTTRAILDAANAAGARKGRIPEKWDGRTAERIVPLLLELGGE